MIYGMVILVIEATGLASASSLSFMILIDAIIFVILAIYAALWSKFKLKLPLFRPLSLEKVMAMKIPIYGTQPNRLMTMPTRSRQRWHIIARHGNWVSISTQRNRP